MSIMGLAGFAEGFGQAKQKKDDQARYDAYLARQEARLGATPMPGHADLSAGNSGGGGSYSGYAKIPQTAQASEIQIGRASCTERV